MQLQRVPFVLLKAEKTLFACTSQERKMINAVNSLNWLARRSHSRSAHPIVLIISTKDDVGRTKFGNYAEIFFKALMSQRDTNSSLPETKFLRIPCHELLFNKLHAIK